MKEFEFVYVLYGRGETEEDALAEALEAFMEDPGDPSETTELKEES